MKPEVYGMVHVSISNEVNSDEESVALMETGYKLDDVQHWILTGVLSDGTVVNFRVHNVEVDFDSLVLNPE